MADPLPWLRRTSLVEAVSYLLLLAVAMPIKYAWADPRPVKVMGMLHGLLFLLLIWLLLRARFEKNWPLSRLGLLFAASLVPLWPFFLDRRVRRWIAGPPA
jgi:integral membrane protein